MKEMEYRQTEGISRSALWKLKELGSPEKFRYWAEHPEPASPALVFGQAVHKLLLEPDGFDDEFVVNPGFDRRTKEGKAAYAEFCEKKGNRTEIKAEDHILICGMVRKAKETPFVSRLLKGEREKPIFWTDEITGEPCKARLDVLTEIGGDPVIVDYKSTADASEAAFQRSAINYGYDLQVAMYSEAVKAMTGKTPKFIFIPQEKAEPFAVNIFEADPLMARRGYDIFRELMGLYHECKTTGNWYGYLGPDNGINVLSLPAWAAKELN